MDIQQIWPGWEVVRKIGSGSFGNVYEIHRDVFGVEEKAALKVLSIPRNTDEVDELRAQGHTEPEISTIYKNHLQQIVREYSIMSQIRGHANVVNCDDVKYVPHDDGIGWDIYIKMELLTPLMKALNQINSEAQVAKLGQDICSALVRCKEKNIIHRDIKPQNIFVAEDGTYKLGDFGIAKNADRTAGGTRIGTYKYMAPEVYNNHPYGAAADVYALGMVLYYLLNDKRTPFLPPAPHVISAGDEEAAGLRRFRGEAIPEPKYGSTELKRIVLKACAYASIDRYASAAEMLADLKALGELSAVAFPVAVHHAAAKAKECSADTVVLNSQETVLLDDQATMLLNEQGTELLEDVEEKQLQTLKKKKKSAFGAFIGALALLIVLLLILLLKSCNGAPVDGGEGSTTTAPTMLSSVTTIPTMGSTPTTGNSTTAPTTGSITTAPTTGKSTTAPTTGSVTTAPTIGNTTTITTTVDTTTTGTTEGTQKVVVVWDYGFNNKEETIYNIYLEEREVLIGSKYSPPYEAARYHHDFYGWYTEPDGKGQKIDTDTVVTLTTKHTLYAYWGVHNHTLRFNLNGGSGSYPSRKINWNCTYGTVGGDLPTPTRAGYTFVGWFTEANGGIKVTQMTKMGDEDVTIYAHWEKIQDNPLGLSYDVNRDGKTCTVTYRGTYKGTDLEMPDSIDGYTVTAIRENAFIGEDLQYVILPGTVTTIGETAFASNPYMQLVMLNNGTTTIGDYAFGSCSSLTTVTIPSSVKNIGEGAFYDCERLADIQFKGTKAQWNAIQKGTVWDSNTGNYTIHCTDGDIPKA